MSGAGEPYQPLLEALTRLCRQPAGGEVLDALRRRAPTWLAQLPSLVPPNEAARLQRALAGTTRERMLRELVDALEAIAARAALVVWLEDLHWSDAATIDWIAAFAQSPDPARVQHKWSMFLELMRWAEGGTCRHDAILRYFGDEAETLAGCGRCARYSSRNRSWTPSSPPPT